MVYVRPIPLSQHYTYVQNDFTLNSGSSYNCPDYTNAGKLTQTSLPLFQVQRVQ
jgi:hypothetical protein